MPSLRNISLKLGSRQILPNLNWEVATGAFIIVVGPNGAGKSSLFGLIAGTL